LLDSSFLTQKHSNTMKKYKYLHYTKIYILLRRNHHWQTVFIFLKLNNTYRLHWSLSAEKYVYEKSCFLFGIYTFISCSPYRYSALKTLSTFLYTKRICWENFQNIQKSVSVSREEYSKICWLHLLCSFTSKKSRLGDTTGWGP